MSVRVRVWDCPPADERRQLVAEFTTGGPFAGGNAVLTEVQPPDGRLYVEAFEETETRPESCNVRPAEDALPGHQYVAPCHRDIGHGGHHRAFAVGAMKPVYWS